MLVNKYPEMQKSTGTKVGNNDFFCQKERASFKNGKRRPD